jgi:hypothetical protein
MSKQARQKLYEKMQHEGARAVGGKNVEPLGRTQHGAPRHSGREIPKPTKAAKLTNEVHDLSPSGKK